MKKESQVKPLLIPNEKGYSSSSSNLLTPEELADLIAYHQKITQERLAENPNLKFTSQMLNK